MSNIKMQTITLELPDVISECYRQDMKIIKEEMKRGIVIWEYVNGHLSLGECGELLKTGYRGFLELLWSRGIPVDALNETELAGQVSQLERIKD